MCPLPGNSMVGPATTYRTVPSNVHPGIVLLPAINSSNRELEFRGKIVGVIQNPDSAY